MDRPPTIAGLYTPRVWIDTPENNKDGALHLLAKVNVEADVNLSFS
jgi:hypothetical protein